ncbi:MAG: hypothetical protein BI182_14935 [Acetobacterium sp. MES1]|uniref:adenylate/guanylate cyclase domain-containing protein n=1 Tax=Acetobacterium sp. MES1 TaxID=1899015 RepID=UPI000B9CE99C|nr:adenylate/guanylate cyclase domain-containing protein [Acetobacterium sp. MES1]OXS26172.1 MAG: hypothetical protein BI182_14935 [Acetobacterium sp. MES1]
MAYSLSKDEFETAKNAIENILTQKVENIELTDAIPPIDEIADSNKVFKGKLSILFVDMRKSTDLTDEIKSKKMVKVYRAFIRSIIQAIRYTGGYSRQFAGDGIMGVFQDSIEDDIKTTSSEKALNAARYILTLIDYCLNPKMKKYMDGLGVACGIGICTGNIMVTKVGMRGKEADEATENELGIVWVGSTTNYASRLCSLATPREIFIDETTFKEIDNEQDIWTKTERLKGTKAFEGYVSKDYYLELPDNVNAELVIGEDEKDNGTSAIEQIFEETKAEALSLIDDISKKSAELSIALANIKKREENLEMRENQTSQKESRLSQKEQQLQDMQITLEEKDKRNHINEYNLNRDFFAKAYPSDPAIKQIGKDFWIKLINDMYLYGNRIEKEKKDVILDLNYYLIDIYYDLDMYEEAYDVLCVCAQYGEKVLFRNFEGIVRKSGHWASLKGKLETRISQSNIYDFQEALNKLKDMGY